MFNNTSQSRFDGRYRAELQPLLVEFYKNFAKPKPEPKQDELRTVVKKILSRVREKDARFHCEVHDVGSVASGLSAVVACEFDILLCVDIPGSDEESALSPGYAKFKLTASSARTWSDVRTGGYLNPRKITDLFQRHVDEVVSSMRGHLHGSYCVGGQGTVATTVSTKEKGFKYKADLVLAVKCVGWPSSANPDIPQDGYDKRWPSAEAISRIKANGYELVAKYVNESTPGIGDTGPDVGLLWRLSVSRAETLLVKTIDADGPELRLCHKECLIIFKALRLHHLVTTSRGVPSADMTILLTSYHLKMLLLHETLTHPNNYQWTDDKLAERFISL
ncbi:cyclic GMP-AMP synthase-like receptor 1 [Liolophura sinensis]|uniref:cyclic GMP-AMP synthase-like receptor 1 n=1 Tax=Liolophura sinensis TaxID=3198878 RepID=UPI0031592CD5